MLFEMPQIPSIFFSMNHEIIRKYLRKNKKETKNENARENYVVTLLFFAQIIKCKRICSLLIFIVIMPIKIIFSLEKATKTSAKNKKHKIFVHSEFEFSLLQLITFLMNF